MKLKISFGPMAALGVVFVALKLSDVIDWSWWWVTLPFWWWPAAMVAYLIAWGAAASFCVVSYSALFLYEKLRKSIK
jgi:hypothetical protein